MAKDATGTVRAFPRNPAGYKASMNEAKDLSAYAQGLNQYTTDRGDDEPDIKWNPEMIGVPNAHRGFQMMPQTPGGKGSKTRASY
jgi:hypothetical protein